MPKFADLSEHGQIIWWKEKAEQAKAELHKEIAIRRRAQQDSDVGFNLLVQAETQTKCYRDALAEICDAGDVCEDGFLKLLARGIDPETLSDG